MDFADDRWLLWVGSVFYGVAFLLKLAALRRGVAWRASGFVLLIAGFVFQSLGLFLRGLKDHSLPLTNAFEIMQAVAWSAIALDLVVRPLFNLKLLNLFASGLGAILAAISLFLIGFDHVLPPLEAPRSPWIGFHAALAVFSYGVFGVLALTSLMYIIQHHGLEARRSGGIFDRLPAIRQLEDINGRLIAFGVSVLTVSVAVGVLDLMAQPGSVGWLKVGVALAVWAGYAFVLILRQLNRLVGAPFAIACVALFTGALLSLWPLTHHSEPREAPAAVAQQSDA